MQVTTLANTRGGGDRTTGEKKSRKHRNLKAHDLVMAVEKSIEKFIERGNDIVRDNPEAAQQLIAVLEEVKSTG
jgi:hypothetical protein